MNLNRFCKRCNSIQPVTLGQFINRASHISYGLRCDTCNGNVPDSKGRIWIPKEDLKTAGIDSESVPLLSFSSGNRCAKCGERGAQLHHWAPKHLFNHGADYWPTDYLCDDCHLKWHNLVTPNMCRKALT